jgi:hypothetical protein
MNHATTGATPNRAIRIPDHLWHAALAVAAGNDESVSEVIRRALVEYVESDTTTTRKAQS